MSGDRRKRRSPHLRDQWAIAEASKHGLNQTARAVLRELAGYADEVTGAAWPSEALIADNIGVHRQAVSRAMQTLIAKGLVSLRDDRRRNTVHTKWLSGAPDWDASQRALDVSEADIETSALMSSSNGPMSSSHGLVSASQTLGRPHNGRGTGVRGTGDSRNSNSYQGEGTEDKVLWSQVLASLQEQVSGPVFRTWLRDTFPVSIQGNVLFIETDSEDKALWLEKRMAGLIEAEVARLSEGSVNVVVFEASRKEVEV